MIIEKKIEIKFELESCWIAFRLNPATGAITGHFKAYDGMTYHNTTELNGETIHNGQLAELLQRATGSTELRPDAVEAIYQLVEFHNILGG